MFAHLSDCPFNKAAEHLEAPPGPVGRYFVTLKNGVIRLGRAADDDPAQAVLDALTALGVMDGNEGGP